MKTLLKVGDSFYKNRIIIIIAHMMELRDRDTSDCRFEAIVEIMRSRSPNCARRSTLNVPYKIIMSLSNTLLVLVLPHFNASCFNKL